jgi:acetyl esterase/lipase
MPIHPDVAARFTLLDGISSMREAYSTPEGLAQIRAYESWDAPPPPSVQTREATVPGPHGPVPVRVYQPRGEDGSARPPCLVWAHGGGFLGGDLDMHEADWTAREVCDRAGAVVVSVDYRLAADGVHYPVPHDDVVAAVAWVRDTADELGIDPARISVGGASAGANLTTGAGLKLRDRDGWVPAALVLVYGVFHPATPTASASLARSLAELPTLLRGAVGDHTLTVNYLGGPLSSADGYAMPALAVLEGLCQTVLVHAEYDDLRASGEAFAAQLAVAGVDVRQVLVRGLLHGFLNQPAQLEPVGRSLDLIADVVARAHAVPETVAVKAHASAATERM